MEELTIVRNGTKHNTLPIRTSENGKNTIVHIGQCNIPLGDILTITVLALYNGDNSEEMQALRKRFEQFLVQKNKEREKSNCIIKELA